MSWLLAAVLFGSGIITATGSTVRVGAAQSRYLTESVDHLSGLTAGVLRAQRSPRVRLVCHDRWVQSHPLVTACCNLPGIPSVLSCLSPRIQTRPGSALSRTRTLGWRTRAISATGGESCSGLPSLPIAGSTAADTPGGPDLYRAVLVSRNPGRDHPPGTAHDQCMDRASTVDCDLSLLTQRSSMHAFVASRVAQPCGQCIQEIG